MRAARKMLLGEAIQIVIALAGVALAVILLNGCSGSKLPPPGPTIDAGTQVANGVCSLLEGVTDNGTIISICATVEEVATIASLVATFLRADADAGACVPLGTTGVCATKAQVGAGIKVVLQRRHLRLIQGGAP